MISRAGFGALLVLAVSVSALPEFRGVSHQQIREDVKIVSREYGRQIIGNYEPDNVTAQCGHEFNTPEQAEEIWFQSSAGFLLEYLLAAYGDNNKNWLQKFASEALGPGYDVGCTTISGNCDINAKCGKCTSVGNSKIDGIGLQYP